MKIFRELSEIQLDRPTVTCLGNFDGVHVGHQELIRRAVAIAKSDGLMAAVFTFSNHPRNLFSDEKVKNILYPEDKAAVMEAMGIDYMFDVPFTMDICTMPAVDFIDRLLVDTFKAREVVCGFDYTFGYKAEGDAALLASEGLKREMGIHVVEPIREDGEVISSTLIRGFIASGDMEKAAKMLGRNYSIEGEVIRGNMLGRTIGFPTCNITVDETMVTPPNGVYITRCTYGGTVYPSITNVGNKPTVGEYATDIETHIFGFDKEIYGETIRVEFEKKIRDEMKFESLEALQAEIDRNCVTARVYHRTHK